MHPAEIVIRMVNRPAPRLTLRVGQATIAGRLRSSRDNSPIARKLMETLMIRKILHTASLTLATIFALSFAAWGSCSNANVKGNYGFVSTTTDTSGDLEASLGHFTANGKGSFTGTQTQSIEGTITTNSVTGTYAVNADCTGSGTITGKGKGASHFDLTVLTAGKRLQIVTTDSGLIGTSYSEAQGSATCTNAGVKGAFGVQSTGTFLTIGPVAFNGLLTLDGSGNLTGTASGSVDGQIFSQQSLSGTYQIKSNCTGTMTFQVSGQQAQHASVVVVSGGKGMLLLETDTGTIVSGSGQQ
jgi:hypothetical protein